VDLRKMRVNHHVEFNVLLDSCLLINLAGAGVSSTP
jgi:hypothetical protein